MAPLPKDDNRIAIQLTPSRIALSRTVSASISAATTVTFNAATTMVRVYAVDKDVYMKWGTTAVTSANFDEIIPANQVVDLVVPVVAATGVLYTACTVIERSATATIILIEK
jgi:hypothetical protein